MLYNSARCWTPKPPETSRVLIYSTAAQTRKTTHSWNVTPEGHGALCFGKKVLAAYLSLSRQRNRCISPWLHLPALNLDYCTQMLKFHRATNSTGYFIVTWNTNLSTPIHTWTCTFQRLQTATDTALRLKIFTCCMFREKMCWSVLHCLLCSTWFSLCAEYAMLSEGLNSSVSCEHSGLSSAVISTNHDHPQGSSKWSRWQTNSLRGGEKN